MLLERLFHIAGPTATDRPDYLAPVGRPYINQFRAASFAMSNQRRGPWSSAEDKYLMELVERHGALNWVQISQALNSRTPKQCRERYHQNLKPTLNHDPISPEEGVEIDRLVREIGKRWAEIARRLRGRSDNAVKNWWNGSQNRRRRLDRRRVGRPASAYGEEYPGPAGHSMIRSPLSSVPRFLPPPLESTQYYHNSAMSNPRRRSSWGLAAPLPSPSSSDSIAESEPSPNYTTSPVHSSSMLHNRTHVELSPLRTATHVELPPLRAATYPGNDAAHLPSLQSILVKVRPRFT